jgi:hypothetical protein
MTIENIFSNTTVYIESITGNVSNVIDNIYGSKVYVDVFSGRQQIYVSETPPSNPNVNDIWIQI